MENKKFLIISVIAVFLIIMGLVVFLYLGRGNLGREKPDPISVQCAFLCETNQKDGFCDQRIRVSDQIRTTCDELSKNSQYVSYNVQKCNSISCVISAQEADQTCVTGLNATWITPTAEEVCPAQEGKFARKRTPSDQPPITNQICCFYYE